MPALDDANQRKPGLTQFAQRPVQLLKAYEIDKEISRRISTDACHYVEKIRQCQHDPVVNLLQDATACHLVLTLHRDGVILRAFAVIEHLKNENHHRDLER